MNLDTYRQGKTMLVAKRVLSLSLFAPALLTIAACSGGDQSADEAMPSALVVQTMDVVAADAYEATQRFSGQVEAARESSLGFELGGELARVVVDEGELVKAGDVLAELDDQRLQAARAEASASLRQADAQAALAEATYERIAEARDFDGVSQQELDQAIEQRERAASAALAAKARLQRLDVDISKSSIRAPYDAAIVRRYIDEGQVVGAGQPVLDIQESAALRVRLAVNGDSLEALRAGDTVDLDLGGDAARATVSAIIPRRNTRTRAVEMILDLDAGAPARVGDIAELAASRRIEQAGFWVPLDALAEGARGVWQVLATVPMDERDAAEARATGATHRLENRPVELLHEEAERVFVRGALRDGDRIVANGIQRVVNGQGVRIVEPGMIPDSQQAATP